MLKEEFIVLLGFTHSNNLQSSLVVHYVSFLFKAGLEGECERVIFF